MHAGPDEQDFIGSYIVDQKPVGLDMALPHALPIAGQLVCAIGGGKLAVLREQFNDCEEIADVFAAPLLTFEVVQEPLLLPDAPHCGSKRAHLLCPSGNRRELFNILALARILDGLLRLVVGNSHWDRKALVKFYLSEERHDGLN